MMMMMLALLVAMLPLHAARTPAPTAAPTAAPTTPAPTAPPTLPPTPPPTTLPPTAPVPASQCAVTPLGSNPVGTRVTWTFNLNFAAVDCNGIVNSVTGLWGNPGQSIQFISYTQGSVIVDTLIDDTVALPPTADVRIQQIQAAFGTATPLGSQIAAASLTSVQRATTTTATGGSSSMIGPIIGGVVGGIILIVVIIIIVVLVARHRQKNALGSDYQTPLLDKSVSSAPIASDTPAKSAGGSVRGASTAAQRASLDASYATSREIMTTSTPQDPLPRESVLDDLCYRVVLKYDLNPVNSDTVTGKAGDRGSVLKTDWDNIEGEWVWVKLNGKEGWAPVAYCERALPSGSRQASLRGSSLGK